MHHAARQCLHSHQRSPSLPMAGGSMSRAIGRWEGLMPPATWAATSLGCQGCAGSTIHSCTHGHAGQRRQAAGARGASSSRCASSWPGSTAGLTRLAIRSLEDISLTALWQRRLSFSCDRYLVAHFRGRSCGAKAAAAARWGQHTRRLKWRKHTPAAAQGTHQGSSQRGSSRREMLTA